MQLLIINDAKIFSLGGVRRQLRHTAHYAALLRDGLIGQKRCSKSRIITSVFDAAFASLSQAKIANDDLPAAGATTRGNLLQSGQSSFCAPAKPHFDAASPPLILALALAIGCLLRETQWNDPLLGSSAEAFEA